MVEKLQVLIMPEDKAGLSLFPSKYVLTTLDRNNVEKVISATFRCRIASDVIRKKAKINLRGLGS